MLSISKPMGGAAASQYHKPDDYYLQEGGSWQGRAAASLGLTGQIDHDDFDIVLEGKDPNTGEQLREIKGDNNRAAVDLTFSAPKSVSILSIFDENMKLAHDQAVANIVDYLEENNIHTREQKNGSRQIINTKNLIAAKFDHLVSRELDPQLHTHAVLMNLTRKENSDWRAIHNDSLYKDKMFLGRLYRNELAYQLRNRGYKIDITDRKQSFFEVEGVDSSLIERFSSRRAQVLKKFEALKKSGAYKNASEGHLMEIAALGSRARKEKGINREALKADWENAIGDKKTLLVQIGRDAQERVSRDFHGVSNDLGGGDQELGKILIRAVKTRTSSEAVFEKKDILGETAKISLGVFSAEQIETAFETVLEEGSMVQLGCVKGIDVYSSREMQMMEQKIISLINQSRNRHSTLYKEAEINAYLDRKEDKQGWKFTAGQRDAVVAAVAGKDLITVIQGDAGTGKTTYAREIKDLIEERGGRVFGVGFTGKAAVELENVGVESRTIDSFLNKQIRFIDQDGNSFSSPHGKKRLAESNDPGRRSVIDIPVGSTLIMDEASMTGNRHFYDLLNIGRDGNLKIIIQGDNKQLSSISAGRMHDILQSMDSVEKVMLHEVLRQRPGSSAYDIVQAFQDDSMKAALGQAREAGHLINYKSRLEGLYRVAAMAAERQENLLVLVDTNRDRQQLNALIRASLIEKNVIAGEGVRLGTRSAVSMSGEGTTAATSYKVGQEVIATEYINKNIKSGDGGRIIKIDEGKNSIFVENGNLVQEINVGFHGDKLSLFDVSARDFATGDKIVFLKNDNLLNVVNGSMGEIRSVSPDGNIAVVLSNGSEISFNTGTEGRASGRINYNYIDHAYALTVHKSQGATTERSIYYHDSLHRMASANSVYVAMTRASEEVTFFTNDEGELLRQASEWDKKTSTLDYENEELSKLGKVDLGDELLKEPETEISEKEKVLELEREVEEEMSMGTMDDTGTGMEMEIDFG